MITQPWPPKNENQNQDQLNQTAQNQTSDSGPSWNVPKIDPISEILQKGQEEKQDYQEKIKETISPESDPNPEIDPEIDPEINQDQDPGSSEGPDLDKAGIEALVEGYDVIRSHALMVWSMEKESDIFEATDSAKKKLIQVAVDYQKKTGKTVKVPDWFPLVIAFVVMEKSIVTKAIKLRKVNKAKKQSEEQKAQEQKPRSTDQPSSFTEPVKIYSTDGIEIDPDYWDERGENNPISEEENLERLRDGGQKCKNCGVNYCKPGKDLCGQKCSGIHRSKKNGPRK